MGYYSNNNRKHFQLLGDGIKARADVHPAQTLTRTLTLPLTLVLALALAPTPTQHGGPETGQKRGRAAFDLLVLGIIMSAHTQRQQFQSRVLGSSDHKTEESWKSLKVSEFEVH